MIFSELYSAYYNTVAAIICKICDGKCSERELQGIVTQKAFGESVLTILPALKSQKWQLVRSDMTTPLKHKPTIPLTTLQKQWLKAISLDPRIKLFDITFPSLDDVEPLFTPDDYYVYDKYSDGDPFDNSEYTEHFRTVLKAIKKGLCIEFTTTDRKGNVLVIKSRPVRLEYSEKDDKFRAILTGHRFYSTVNLAKISSCDLCQEEVSVNCNDRQTVYDTVTVKLYDERNTLERFMLHFAHFEKQAERLDNRHYIVRIKYPCDDISEMIIRMLSFGPMVEVTQPEAFKRVMTEKLKRQFDCGLE